LRYPQRYAKTEALMVKAPIFPGAIKLRNVLDCQAKILEAVMDRRQCGVRRHKIHNI
jgi:hypothetical protein